MALHSLIYIASVGFSVCVFWGWISSQAVRICYSAPIDFMFPEAQSGPDCNPLVVGPGWNWDITHTYGQYMLILLQSTCTGNLDSCTVRVPVTSVVSLLVYGCPLLGSICRMKWQEAAMRRKHCMSELFWCCRSSDLMNNVKVRYRRLFLLKLEDV